MKINTSKTVFQSFSAGHKTLHPRLSYKDTALSRSSEFKYLGVIFDKKLNWKTKLGVFHPVVCTCKRILYLTVVRQQCGAMFLLCNYQLNDMFRPYRAIIKLHKIVVIRQGTCGSLCSLMMAL